MFVEPTAEPLRATGVRVSVPLGRGEPVVAAGIHFDSGPRVVPPDSPGSAAATE